MSERMDRLEKLEEQKRKLEEEIKKLKQELVTTGNVKFEATHSRGNVQWHIAIRHLCSDGVYANWQKVVSGERDYVIQSIDGVLNDLRDLKIKLEQED